MDLAVHLPQLDLDEINLEDWTKLIKPRETPLRPYQLIRPLGGSLQTLNGNLRLSVGELDILGRVIENLSFEASLIQDWEENGYTSNCLRLKALQADFSEEISLNANIDLINFEDPIIRTNFSSTVDFKKLNDVFPQDLFKFMEGEVVVQASLTAKLEDNWDYQSFLSNAEILGNLKVLDGEFDYLYRGFEVRDMQGYAHFDSRDLHIDTLLFDINGNHVSGYGLSKGILDYFLLDNQSFHADMKVRTNTFNFDNFSTPEKLGQSIIDTTATDNSFSPSKIRALLSSGTAELGLEMDEAIIQNFNPKYVKGSARVTADSVKLNELTMQIAKGDFVINGGIRELKSNNPKADVNIVFRKCDVSKVFSSFNNFGQSDLKSDNINGTASAIIDFQTRFDADYKPQSETISGQMFLEIVDGELKNIPAMKNLSGWQFIGRNLEDIAFDTLRNRTHFRGLDLLIEKFYIHSTVLDFGVQGIYSFGDDDKSHLYFELPAENLYMTHIDKALLSKIDQRRRGIPIFIQAVERNNKFVWKPAFFASRKRKWMIKRALEERDQSKISP